MSEQEKKDKKYSVIFSSIVHGSLLAIFLLLVAWREPDPPRPEYGMELAFGTETEGSGDVVQETETVTEETENETPPDAETDTEETHEEVVEEEVVE